MSIDQELCGLFGKIPQQSDFVSHHLCNSFTDYWHKWLQSSLSISHEQMANDWLNNYLISPIWHFAIMPKIAHDEAIVGVMIPSVDEVGRYFPITLAHIGNHNIWSAYLNGTSWYSSIEKVALLSLRDNTTYSSLLEALESLSIPEFDNIPTYKTLESSHSYKGNQLIRFTEDMDKQSIALSLLPKIYENQFGNHSIWWTSGSEKVLPSLAISTNLPDPGQFSAMLDGDWQQWGWSEDAIMDGNNSKETA